MQVYRYWHNHGSANGASALHNVYEEVHCTFGVSVQCSSNCGFLFLFRSLINEYSMNTIWM